MSAHLQLHIALLFFCHAPFVIALLDDTNRYESRGMTIDVDEELSRYKQLADKVRPFVTETGCYFVVVYFFHLKSFLEYLQ